MSQNVQDFFKRIGLVVLIITTVLLASCPPPNQPTSPDQPPQQGAPNTPPAAPTSLEFTIGDGEITLTWNAVTGAVSYRIYRDGERIAADIDITEATYIDDTAVNDTEYRYTVRSVARNGLISFLSTEVIATPSASLAAPENLMADGTGGVGVLSRIQLDVDHFQEQRLYL